MSNASRSSIDTPTNRLITIEQAAEYLSVSKWTVRQMTYERKLPAVMIGRRVLIDRKDLDKFIEISKVT